MPLVGFYENFSFFLIFGKIVLSFSPLMLAQKLLVHLTLLGHFSFLQAFLIYFINAVIFYNQHDDLHSEAIYHKETHVGSNPYLCD